MKKHIHHEQDTTFFERRVEHAKKHWYSYGLGAVAAGTIVTLAITAAWSWSALKIDTLKFHYRQSDLNTIRITALENDVSNLTVRVHNQWATNRQQDAQISALQQAVRGLR